MIMPSPRLVRMLDRLKGGNAVRVVVLISSMIMIAHWLACIWSVPVCWYA